MKRQFTFVTMLTLFIALHSGCTKKKSDAKSMEQLHKENGIPVRVETVQQKPFTIEHSFYAVLSGIKESDASAMVADKVDKIHYDVGDAVRRNAVVISFPTDNPAAQYYQAKVGYEHAEATLKRMKNLHENGGISLQDYEGAETQYKVAKANWAAVKQTVKVKAPISGVVTSIKVQESDNVHPGDVLFTISQTSKLKSKLWVPENQIQDITSGLRVTASWNDVMLEGEVTQVDMSLNSHEQAFGVAVEFDNADGAMMNGVNASIQVYVTSDSETIIVDRKDVIKKENQYFVFLAEKGLAKATQVELGKTHGIQAEIVSGLRPGATLITEGQLLLTNGSKIKVMK